ncbi:hypothetical protein ES703_50860 [subsurface metagenome]
MFRGKTKVPHTPYPRLAKRAWQPALCARAPLVALARRLPAVRPYRPPALSPAAGCKPVSVLKRTAPAGGQIGHFVAVGMDCCVPSPLPGLLHLRTRRNGL